MPSIEARTRKSVASFLPDAIACALETYKQFAEREVSEEPAKFKTHHDACKVAIAHIQLLIKLAEWAELPDLQSEDQKQQTTMVSMLESARKEIQKYEEEGTNE